MNKKKIVWGVLLILAAVAVIINAMDIIPQISVIKILITVFLVYLIIHGIVKKDIGMILIPTSLIVCQYAYMFHNKVLDQLTPWPLLGAAVLLSIGLGMLFEKKTTKIHFGKDFSDVKVDNFEDGEKVKLENAFGSVSKYVNTNSFHNAKIDNSFGTSNVYFNNAILAKEGAIIKAENAFGQINIYLPATWRVNLIQESAFGRITAHGLCNSDADAPLVTLEADTSFGSIDIYYN